MPSREAIVECWLWFEWPDSTDSQNVPAEREGRGRMWILWLLKGSLGEGEVEVVEEEGNSGRDVAPLDFIAEKRTPRPSIDGGEEEDDGGDGRGAAGSVGRFGHPSTPTFTPPSSISARQTAYWPPRRKPFVPSTGSMAHTRPSRPPSALP